MQMQRGLLAILNSNEKETRNLSPGGICKSRQPPELLPTSAFGPKGETDTGKQARAGGGVLDAEGSAPDLGLTLWWGRRYPI